MGRKFLLVGSNCRFCPEAEREFRKKYPNGEVLNVETPEGLALAQKHKVEFVPFEVEEKNGDGEKMSALRSFDCLY